MKKPLLFSFIFLFISTQVFAQLFVSTKHRDDAHWSSSEKQWKITSTKAEPTLFKFNDKMTMFEHTTANISSAYYISNQKFNEANKQYEFDIVSDVGNKYVMIIDIPNNNLRFLYERNGVAYMVRHTIKSSWEQNATSQGQPAATQKNINQAPSAISSNQPTYKPQPPSMYGIDKK